jgi:hypothetical protein
MARGLIESQAADEGEWMIEQPSAGENPTPGAGGESLTIDLIYRYAVDYFDAPEDGSEDQLGFGGRLGQEIRRQPLPRLAGVNEERPPVFGWPGSVFDGFEAVDDSPGPRLADGQCLHGL